MKPEPTVEPRRLKTSLLRLFTPRTLKGTKILGLILEQAHTYIHNGITTLTWNASRLRMHAHLHVNSKRFKHTLLADMFFDLERLERNILSI